MNELRIKEAMTFALMQGKKVSQRELGGLLWPDSRTSTIDVNVSKLFTGKTKRISAEWVAIICNYTGVDANFLFNINQNN